MQRKTTPNKGRILTGDRPTGRLHLGHLLGSLQNRVALQDTCDTILIVADLHMLTTRPGREDIDRILQNARGLVLDYLAAGIDPERTTVYLQSGVPEVYELNTLFQNMVSVARLRRLPSLKDMAHAKSAPSDQDDTFSYGLLGYPVLQAADILLPRATLVPVGRDNLAHVEIAREIARRFNYLYDDVFPEPEPLLGEVPSLVGTCGKAKMSKSLDNAIFLSDNPATIARKVRKMFTDPHRVHAHIPGRVEGNPVFVYHDAFNPNREQVEELKARYRAGKVGDGEVKALLTEALVAYLAPVHQRLEHLESDPARVDEILLDGTAHMRTLAGDTMRKVRRAMGLQRALTRMRRAAEKRARRQAAR